jgi:intron-binding protein aquarius
MGEVLPPHLGENLPSSVKATVQFNVGAYTDAIRREWDSLRQHDVLFLVSLQMEPTLQTNLPSTKGGKPEALDGSTFKHRYGVKSVRGCKILEVLSTRDEQDSQLFRGAQRTFTVALDPFQYQLDSASKLAPTFNVIIRRKGAENNFAAVLESVRDVMASSLNVPEWLQDVLLGYGDPNGASYTEVENPVLRIDMRDTFLDWAHLNGCFKDMVLYLILFVFVFINFDSFFSQNFQTKGEKGSVQPPYVLTFPKEMFTALKELDEDETLPSSVSTHSVIKQFGDLVDLPTSTDSVLVESYKAQSMGPFPENARKKNLIRFTPSQAHAVLSGSSPGLTLIVGPPGVCNPY